MADDDDYMDYIKPRGLPVLKATLRVIVAVQCFGAAAQRLSQGAESKIANFLLVDMNWPDATVVQYDNYFAYGLVACGVLTLLRPCWPVLLPVTAWFAASSLIPAVREEGAIRFLEPIEHAARWTAPLGLMVLDFWPPRMKSHLGRTVMCMWLLRLAAAATFAGHGIVALMHATNGGHFIDLLTATTGVVGWELTQQQTRWALLFIGAVDIGLALNVLTSRSKPIVFWMMCWGFATATTRVIEGGPEAYPQVLLRIANGGLPLVLLLYWSLSIKEGPVEVVKAE